MTGLNERTLYSRRSAIPLISTFRTASKWVTGTRSSGGLATVLPRIRSVTALLPPLTRTAVAIISSAPLCRMKSLLSKTGLEWCADPSSSTTITPGSSTSPAYGFSGRQRRITGYGQPYRGRSGHPLAPMKTCASIT